MANTCGRCAASIGVRSAVNQKRRKPMIKDTMPARYEMSREIKFRGKRVHNGEWVYGSLIQYSAFTKIYSDEQSNFYHIDPETVGQYTGLTDKNGREIYEGDKCSFSGVEEIGVVVWDEWVWSWEFCGERQDYDGFIPEDIEVIGTIHDKEG
jgi:hypothetical protein